MWCILLYRQFSIWEVKWKYPVQYSATSQAICLNFLFVVKPDIVWSFYAASHRYCFQTGAEKLQTVIKKLKVSAFFGLRKFLPKTQDNSSDVNSGKSDIFSVNKFIENFPDLSREIHHLPGQKNGNISQAIFPLWATKIFEPRADEVSSSRHHCDTVFYASRFVCCCSLLIQ